GGGGGKAYAGDQPRTKSTPPQRASAKTRAAGGRREAGAFLIVELTLAFQSEDKGFQKFSIIRHTIGRSSLRAGADPLTPAEQGALAPLIAGVVAKVPKVRPEGFQDFMPGPELSVSTALMPQDLDYYRRGQYLPDQPVHAIADAIRNATSARRETQKETSRALSAKEYAELIRRGRLAAKNGIDMVADEKKERA